MDKSTRADIIRNQILTRFIPLMGDQTTMVQFNEAADKLLESIQRQFEGAETAAVTRYLQSCEGPKPEVNHWTFYPDSNPTQPYIGTSEEREPWSTRMQGVWRRGSAPHDQMEKFIAAVDARPNKGPMR